MKLKALSLAVAAATLATLSTGASAAALTDGWSVGGYGKVNYTFGESYDKNTTWSHADGLHAAGPFFSANYNQVEFTLKKESTYKNGVWANYVLRTEYGNNENPSNFSQGYYGSSSGNEGHLESGALEFKEVYIELGGLKSLAKDMSLWAGRRYLNRQQGVISKQFFQQSSGVGVGIAYNKMGLAVVSADPGAGYCYAQQDWGGDGNVDPWDENNTVNAKNCNVDSDNGVTGMGSRRTVTSIDAYFYQLEALGGQFNFDAKYYFQENSAGGDDTGFGVGVMYARDYYGLEGWSVTQAQYGEDMGAFRPLNFGQWKPENAGAEGDKGWTFVTQGVLNISDRIQLGTEIHYIEVDGDDVFGSGGGIVRSLVGITPSFKVNDNFRIELIGTWGREDIDAGWSSGANPDEVINFYTATLAPVFTVNADYFGRPQIKPYVTYMTNDQDVAWGSSLDSDSETVFGIEGEIWF